MTEWNGIKVGGLYTDKLDTFVPGGPALMVCISIRKKRRHRLGPDEAEVTFLWRGKLTKHRVPRDWAGWNDWCVLEHKAFLAAGPYVEVA